MLPGKAACGRNSRGPAGETKHIRNVAASEGTCKGTGHARDLGRDASALAGPRLCAGPRGIVHERGSYFGLSFNAAELMQ